MDFQTDHHIRPAADTDLGRIAEILVFNNRLNYFPIFQDVQYSFRELNVLDVANQFLADSTFLPNCYVYDFGGIILGFVYTVSDEIRKLYVDSFFQKRGCGSALIDFAIHEKSAQWMWVLEKNYKARRFYERHGFRPSGEVIKEEGTTENLLKYVRMQDE